MSYVLGIDLGTTYTSAAVVVGGRVEVVQLGVRSSVVPTVVYLTEEGQMLTGEAANRRAASAPARVAREFKRRVGDTAPLLLGGTPMAPQALMGSMLRWVLDRVSAERGEPPTHVAVTHPANWGPYKLDLLEQAVRLADLDSVTMLTEPEAAARCYASTQRLAPGDIVAVYDLGGGTFDAAVVQATDLGFEILGSPEGIEHLGGIDIDEAVFGFVARELGGALENLDLDDPVVTAGAARLRRDCVEAKEALSSDTEAVIPVLLPGLQSEVRITRDELEAMVRPSLAATIGALERAIRSAQVTPDQLAAVLLVGGTSRMPLVAELVGEALGRPVAVDAHPKHAVSLGAALAAEAALTREQGLPQPAAEIIPPRATPLPSTAESAPSSEPPSSGGRPSGGRAHPTIPSGTPGQLPPAVPPPPPGSGGDGGDFDGDRDGEGHERDRRRLLYIGGPVAVVVILAAVLFAVRGDGDGAGGAAESTAVETTAPPPTAEPVETTEPSIPSTELAAITEPPVSSTGPVETTEPPAPTTEPGETTAPTTTTTSLTSTTLPPVPSAEVAGLTNGQRLSVGAFPDGVTADAVGGLWIASTFDDQVTRVEPDTGRQQVVPFEAGAEPLAVIASQNAIFVTLRGIDRIARVDPETFGIELLPVSDAPVFLASGADSLWSVAGSGIDRIDPDSFTVTATIAVTSPQGVAIVGDAAWATSTGNGGELVKIDLTTNAVVATFPIGAGPDAIAADGDAVWVANRGEGTVARFDTVTGQVTDRLGVGTAPAGIAIDGDRVWVIDVDEGNLLLIDRVTVTPVDSIAVGRRPLGLQPLDDRVWVSLAGDNGLAEVRVLDQAPVDPRAEIIELGLTDARFVPMYAIQNFIPNTAGGLQVHLYWNVIPVVEAAVPGPGPWLAWRQPGPVDDPFFDVANRPAGANAICIVVVDAAEHVADVDGDGAPDYDTGNCVQLPEESA